METVQAPVTPEVQESEQVPPNMTGAEAKAWFEAQKNKQTAQPRTSEGKFQTKQTSVPNLVKEAAKEASQKSKVPIPEAPNEEVKEETPIPKKFKVKVDGQEMEVDESELLRGYTHQRAANKKLQEGLTLRKQAEEFVRQMKDKNSLFDAIKKLGHDPRKLAEEYLVSQLEEEMLDPKEKEIRAMKLKLREHEDLQKRHAEAIAQKQHEELKSSYAKNYTDQFVSALKESGLPATKPMVKEMAGYIKRAAELGYEMTAIEAAKMVQEDVAKATQRLIGDSDGEVLLKLLGPQVSDKLRKYELNKIKTPESQLQTPGPSEQSSRVPRNPGKRMTPAQWRAYNRGR